MKRDAPLNEYIASVSSALICPKKQKKAFLSELRAEAEAYLAENQNATKEEIEGFFGTPESIASSFISNSDSTEIKRQINLKRLIAVAVIAALLIYLAFVVISFIDVHSEAHGYFEEGLASAAVVTMKGGVL